MKQIGRHVNACINNSLKKQQQNEKREKFESKRKNAFGHGHQKLSKFFKPSSEKGSLIGSSSSTSESVISEISASLSEIVYSIVKSELQAQSEIQVLDTQSCILLKCDGYHPFVTNFFSDLPCHLLKDIDIVIENSALHHKSCAENDYVLNSKTTFNINKACINNQSLVKLVDKSKKSYTDKELQTLNHKYLSHKQLAEKAAKLQEQKRDLRLTLTNSQFKNSKLCATISLHNRLLVLISEHKVSHLQQLIKVALNNGRSIRHILTKISDAIDGLYRPNPSQNDRDLAFLVLKLGGPSLLEILFRAGVLPSVSTAYRMSKKCPPLLSSLQSSISDCFDANISLTHVGKSSQSLKLDDNTAVLSYNSKDNQAYGFCYQHGSHIKLEIHEYEDCERLQTMVENDELHIPNECLVAGLAGLNENTAMQPLLIWPSCSKKDVDGTITLIEEVNEKLKEKNGFPLMNEMGQEE